MSQEHLESLVAKIKKDPDLVEELKGQGPHQVVETASKHGYTITAPEVLRHHAATLSQMSDDQLDEVAGGGIFSDIGHAFGSAAHWVSHHSGDIEAAGELGAEIAE